jgi:hypothetical protein
LTRYLLLIDNLDANAISILKSIILGILARGPGAVICST